MLARSVSDYPLATSVVLVLSSFDTVTLLEECN